jgi:hypothetical protein
MVLRLRVEILGEDVELFSSVNARRRKDVENPARGIAKITKHGNVQCIAGHNMVFLSKDYNMDSYILGCPVLNEEARKKLEHMGLEVPEEHKCEKKGECSPNSEIGRIYRAKRNMLTQIDWDNPQFSYHFKLIHSLRTEPALAKAGDRTFIFPYERAFQDAACLQAWSWQYSRPHTQVHESHPYSRKCNGNLWGVGFRIRR